MVKIFANYVAFEVRHWGTLMITNLVTPSNGKRNKFGYFLVVIQLIHIVSWAGANVSCTTTTKLPN